MGRFIFLLLAVAALGAAIAFYYLTDQRDEFEPRAPAPTGGPVGVWFCQDGGRPGANGRCRDGSKPLAKCADGSLAEWSARCPVEREAATTTGPDHPEPDAPDVDECNQCDDGDEADGEPEKEPEPRSIDASVYFESGSDELTPEGEALVAALALKILEEDAYLIILDGHTDTSGAANENYELSRRRGEAVRSALIREGVSRDIIRIRPLGEEALAKPSPDGVEEPLNNRVEVRIGTPDHPLADEQPPRRYYRGRGRDGGKRRPGRVGPFANSAEEPAEDQSPEESSDTDYIGETFADGERPAGTPAPDTRLAEAVAACLQAQTCEMVDVLFGSSRQIDFSRPLESANRFGVSPATPFSTELSDRLTLGEILVVIPLTDAHKKGRVERPRRQSIPFSGGRYLGQRLDPLKHFVLYDYARLSRARFGDELAEVKSAFVFVHGYNVSMKSAAMKAAQLKVDSGFDGQAMIFSWPTKHPGENSLTTEYHPSREQAAASRAQFREFIELVRARTDAGVVHIVAHSMGNYMMLDALADFNEARPAALRAPEFGELIMAAPDVEQARFIDLMARIDGLFEGATLYASSSDLAMTISRGVCLSREGRVCPPRAGDVPAPPAGPAVAPTHETIDTSTLEDRFFEAVGHGYYSGERAVLDDIGRLLVYQDRPANRRIPSLRRVEHAGHYYWRFD